MTFVPEHWDVGLWDQAHWDGQRGIDALAGAVTVTRNAATLRVGRRVVATKGTITVTGNAATLRVGRRAVALTGSIVVAGKALTLRRGYRITASTGTIRLSGSDTWDVGLWDQAIWDGRTIYAILRVGRRLVTQPGVVTLTGNPIGMRKAGVRTLVASAGHVTLTGIPVGTVRVLYATTSTIWLNSIGVQSAWDVGLWDQATWDDGALFATLRVGRRSVAQAGLVTIAGWPVELLVTHAYKLVAAAGSILVTGYPANLRVTRLPPRYEPVSFASLMNRKVDLGILRQRTF